MTIRTLWRATSAESPWFGTSSFWASDRSHAERYLRSPGFGGPQLHSANVNIADEETLDLRVDPWGILSEQFGLEREEYPEGECDHELFWALANVFKAHGYRWVIFREGGNPGEAAQGEEEWMYLGDEPLPAQIVTNP